MFQCPTAAIVASFPSKSTAIGVRSVKRAEDPTAFTAGPLSVSLPAKSSTLMIY